MTHRSAHRRRRERGEVTATVLMVPVILFAMLFVVQFSLAFYARQVLAGAAQDGAAAGARQSSSPGQGTALTDRLVDESVGALLTSHRSVVSVNADTVVVTATGDVVSLLPFFGTIRVSGQGSARLEQFEPQATPP